MGPKRHLSLIPEGKARRIPWPMPFSDGVERLMALRGQPTVVLVSGDPFWFGAGTTLARRLGRNEWRAFPGRSAFSLVAARMGWGLEATLCIGLHAAPLSRLKPQLAPDRQMIVLLRDGAALRDLAAYLAAQGFGASSLTVMESLDGPRERLTEATADTLPEIAFSHPVCAALRVAGGGAVLPLASGRPDDAFDSDGVMTKRPVRALTLSTLAPRPFEHLWDIGGGSGTIGIEWLLTDPSLRATAIEPRGDRVALIRANADRLGADRLTIVHGTAPDALADLPAPDVVFVGGGLSPQLLAYLETLPKGTRLVANSVTLESEALLTTGHARLGGELMRIEIAHSAPIGPKRGWRSSFPITQWSHVL